MDNKKFAKRALDRETADEMRICAKSVQGIAAVAEMLAILRCERGE